MSDLNQNPNVNQPQDQEDLEMWMKVLSFCIPSRELLSIL